ncbi:hypothetical protein GBAR_LOCUS19090 [Geodia barretti]|uniref:Uncharacterized protein n=1 Tax=Geodia barretti TaxID=519541 RepID=A0AA35WU49_GEOBA|nr:hypothetical protein GBAR_LOCUS19090 [Geodia barretti]
MVSSSPLATTFNLSMVAYLQHSHEHQSDCNNKCSVARSC